MPRYAISLRPQSGNIFFNLASACGVPVPVPIPISDGFGAVFGKMTQGTHDKLMANGSPLATDGSGGLGGGESGDGSGSGGLDGGRVCAAANVLTYRDLVAMQLKLDWGCRREGSSKFQKESRLSSRPYFAVDCWSCGGYRARSVPKWLSFFLKARHTAAGPDATPRPHPRPHHPRPGLSI